MDAKSNGNAHSPAYPWGEHGQVLGGLTKRELFAAMAMQGFLANKGHATYFSPDDDANYCVRIADAMLAELAKDGAA